MWNSKSCDTRVHIFCSRLYCCCLLKCVLSWNAYIQKSHNFDVSLRCCQTKLWDYITFTVGANRTEQELSADRYYLLRPWQEIPNMGVNVILTRDFTLKLQITFSYLRKSAQLWWSAIALSSERAVKMIGIPNTAGTLAMRHSCLQNTRDPNISVQFWSNCTSIWYKSRTDHTVKQNHIILPICIHKDRQNNSTCYCKYSLFLYKPWLGDSFACNCANTKKALW